MSTVHAVVPPYMSERILAHYQERHAQFMRGESEEAKVVEAAVARVPEEDHIGNLLTAQRASMAAMHRMRHVRRHAVAPGARAGLAAAAHAAGPSPREVWDARTRKKLLGTNPPTHAQGQLPVGAQVAFDNMQFIDDYYQGQFHIPPVKNATKLMKVYVNSPEAFNNGFWADELEAVSFGGVDRRIFTPLVLNYGVIAHEFTHAVTHYSTPLEYSGQSGALNESMSDVFASVMKQFRAHQTVDQADWLIGEGTVVNDPQDGTALRSMRAPGTAYRNQPVLGDDPQPASMAQYQDLPDTEDGDNGGVHINSGIPNRAFYLVSTGFGGNSWDKPAHIWYTTLTTLIQPTAQFIDFAQGTVTAAKTLYGAGNADLVAKSWQQVGVDTSGQDAGVAVMKAESLRRPRDVEVEVDGVRIKVTRV